MDPKKDAYDSSDYSHYSDAHESIDPDSPLMIPYEPSEDDESFSLDDPHYIDSGWAGECLHDDSEDIDFEFVYALHTFVATVEGQANATKGDTMVLLDDSNSYWWLVRVVKDSSIGKSTELYVKTGTNMRRVLACGAHRNAYREVGKAEQAPEC